MEDNKIREKILNDAKNDAEQIINEAKDKAKQILEDAKKRVKVIEKETETLAGEARLREIERRLSGARMESRMFILNKKRQIIDALFDEAKKRLLSLKKSEYIDFIVKMIKDEAKAENFTFVLSEKDVNRFGKEIFHEILKRLNLNENLPFETGLFDGGCILKKERYEFNATIDTILGRVKERLESKLAEILFT